MKIIKDNPDKSWDWYWMSRNPLINKKKNLQFKNIASIWLAYKIKKWWLKKCYDPKYPMIT